MLFEVCTGISRVIQVKQRGVNEMLTVDEIKDVEQPDFQEKLDAKERRAA